MGVRLRALEPRETGLNGLYKFPICMAATEVSTSSLMSQVQHHTCATALGCVAIHSRPSDVQ